MANWIHQLSKLSVFPDMIWPVRHWGLAEFGDFGL